MAKPTSRKKAEKLNTEIHLPIDVVAGDKFNNSTKEEVFNITQIPPGWSGMDISSKSITAFENIIMSSNTVFWNGPMGVFEKEKFSNGTGQICKILKKAKDEKNMLL